MSAMELCCLRSPHLHRAPTVLIDFGDQNNKVGLNPVTIWASTIRRLRSYRGYSADWEVFTYYDGANSTKVKATETLADLRATVASIGSDTLGFKSKEIGTHSIRASLAM